MSSTNPYSAPRAQEAWEVEEPKRHNSWLEKNFLWLLFSFRGRIPRLGYWAANLILTVVLFAAVFAIAKFVTNPQVAQIIIGLVYLPLVWSSVAIAVKRWHDRDKSGWWFLLNFVPIVGPLWTFIELGFCRGTYGDNRFGEES